MIQSDDQDSSKTVVHQVPRNENICRLVNIKALFGDPNKQISGSFLYLEDGLLTNVWGRKFNQPLSLSPGSDSFICPAAVTPHFMYFACIVYQLWTRSLMRSVTRGKSQISGRDRATLSLKMLNLDSLLQLMRLWGLFFTMMQLKGGGNSLRHVSETTLNASSKGALMLCLRKGLLARNKSGRHK